MATWMIRLREAVGAHPTATRWGLAGPGAIAAALMFTVSMPVWFPAGAAGVNHVAWPMVLAPLAWGVAFTYACVVDDLVRGVLVLAGVTGVGGLLCAVAMLGGFQ